MIDWTLPQKCENTIQHYAWGCEGEDAYLAKLCGLSSPNAPLAELWMGAHVKAPSKIEGEGLDTHLAQHAEAILGPEGIEKFGSSLPYLFKVLSSKEALSIQLHPNKKEAEVLHAKDPEHYPDDNHKPEIAIALDELEALLGFDSIENILENLKINPEMSAFIGAEAVERLASSLDQDADTQVSTLQSVFTSLFVKMEADRAGLASATAEMAKRLALQGDTSPRAKWFCSLQKKYSEGDVGLFCLYFLAYRTLSPGEGVFLKADVPHAYLKGNIIECMANSDNVVRAGLTPKFVDVETLSDIVVVELEPLKVQHAEPNGCGGGVFQVPVDEFEVHHFSTQNESEAESQSFGLEALKGARIAICTSGQGRFSAGPSFSKGDVFLLANACSVSMELAPGSEMFVAKPTL